MSLSVCLLFSASCCRSHYLKSSVKSPLFVTFLTCIQTTSKFRLDLNVPLKSNSIAFQFLKSWRQPFRQSPIVASAVVRKMGRKDRHIVYNGVLVINSESLPETMGDVALNLASPGRKEACFPSNRIRKVGTLVFRHARCNTNASCRWSNLYAAVCRFSYRRRF